MDEKLESSVGYIVLGLFAFLLGLRLTFGGEEAIYHNFPIHFGEYRHVAGVIFMAIGGWFFAKARKTPPADS
ncbi:MAG: hypothetical protein R3F12_10495 [Lysobacteraceae bacterium]